MITYIRNHLYSFLFLIVSCGTVKSKPANPNEGLREMMTSEREKANAVAASYHGWLANDCDAMKWAGLAACGGVKTFSPRSAEYPNEPGRFNRRPDPFCEVGAGSATSWSRDMSLGFMGYGLCARDSELMIAHADYGSKHLWQMGAPLDDGRVLYTPNIQGILFQLIFALTGQNNFGRFWPSFYPSDLTGYEVGLVTISIWLRGEIAAILNEPQNAPSKEQYLRLVDQGFNFTDVTAAQISALLYKRLKDYAEADKTDVMNWAIYSKYNGDWTHATELCLAGYSDTEDHSPWAKWLFSCSIVLGDI